jgi:hypothetical protein
LIPYAPQFNYAYAPSSFPSSSGQRDDDDDGLWINNVVLDHMVGVCLEDNYSSIPDLCRDEQGGRCLVEAFSRGPYATREIILESLAGHYSKILNGKLIPTTIWSLSCLE